MNGISGIKILLITGIAFIAVYYFLRLRNTILDIILLLALVATGVVFVIFPDLTTDIARYVGVDRGADLIFYISIITFWFVILKLYARIRRLEQIVTDVVRKDALENSEKIKDKN
jgi:small membrane protein